MHQRQIWLKISLGLGILLLVSALNARAQTLEERVQRLETQLPAWLKILQFSGDFRLRYQYEDETDEPARNRGRFRYRLAVDANILENLKVGFGLASGGDDPRSTNQTFQDSFSHKDINIDLAFAEYRPTPWLDLIGGKFKNPLWTPSDWLWDSDIRPEGGAIFLHYKVQPGLELFLVSGVWVIDEDDGGDDPFMMPIQGGVTFALTPQITLQFAAAYYAFMNVQGAALDFSSGTNTTNTVVVDDEEVEVLAFDYNAVVVSGELGFAKIFGSVIPYIGLIGEYVNNIEISNADDGFLVGIKFGHRRMREQGQWQVQYTYRRLDRNAWLDIFPDADFLNGETNAKGHEFMITYGVLKYVEVGIDYYHAMEIEGSTKQDLFQFDIVIKFP